MSAKRQAIVSLSAGAIAGVLLIAGAAVAGEGCGVKHAGSAAGKTAVVEKESKTAPQKTLLFFMNPNGRPCQMQDEILGQIRDSLEGCATVRYIKTTVEQDRALFGQYGIRGLPSLIVVDNSGKDLHRFTPGIQPGETILATLRK